MRRPRSLPKDLPKVLSTLVAASAVLSGCVRSPITPESEVPSTVETDVANASQGQVSADIERSSSAMHYFLMGQLSVAGEDYKGALENFDKAGELIDGPAPLVHIRLAELYLRFGKLEEALEPAKKALQEQPNDPHVHLLYGGVLEALGRDKEAEPVFRGVVERFPEKFDAYVLLANLMVREKRYSDAVEVLKKLIAKAPSDPTGHYYLGVTYEEMGNLPDAEREYSTVVELDPQGMNARAELLRVLLKQQQYEKAKGLCNRILQKDPNNVLARKVLGHLMMGENKFDEALNHLQVAEGVEPGVTDTHFKIALIQIEKQNFREAVRELTLVLAQNPKQSEARYYLASIYAGSGRRKEAIEELSKIDSSSEMFVKSRTFAAFVLRQDSRLKEAEEAIREALEIEPNNKNLTLYLVLALRDQDKPEEARKVLEGALEKDPKNERFLFNLGLVYHDLGKESQALATMEQILVVNPQNTDALNFVAYALAEDGKDLPRASNLIHKALEIRPNDGFYLDTLGWVQFKSGDLKGAEESLSRAVSAAGDDPVLIEHYVEVLIANGKFPKAVSLLKAAIEQPTNSAEDGEKRLSRERMKRRLAEILQKYPELQSVEKSDLPKPDARSRIESLDEVGSIGALPTGKTGIRPTVGR